MTESKSKSESEKEEPKRDPREPRALSSEYHKARKQLMLWAGILFIWELVGIDLERTKDAEGYVGALIKSIKSPQAVPWVLLILVAYFLFKVSIEWHQCNAARRALRVARIDYLSAWIVSLLAGGLYIAQTLSRVQVADLVQSGSRGSFAFGAAVGMTLAFSLEAAMREFPPKGAFEMTAVAIGPTILLIGIIISKFTRWHISWKPSLVMIVVFFLIQLVAFIVINPHSRNRWRRLLTRLWPPANAAG